MLRRHQTTKLCQQRDFLNWVAWQWRSKDTFEQLLWYTMKRAGTSQRGLSYVQKVAKVYGCDVDSQFQVIPEWATLLCRWGDLAKQHRANTTLPITYVQQLAIDYYKARFQVGHIYSVPMEVAELARSEETEASTLTVSNIVDAYFDLPDRPLRLLPGDTVFTVVDSTPESRYHMTSSHVVRNNSDIVVRVHAPVTAADQHVPAQWTMETWDLRGWLRSTASFKVLTATLLHVCEPGQQTVSSLFGKPAHNSPWGTLRGHPCLRQPATQRPL